MAGWIEYTADLDWVGMVEMDSAALVASATDIPVKPPKTWFDDPGLTRLSPLTIEGNGRVFGHVASWEGSHIGRLGKVKAPRSGSQYQYFRTGVIETEDGSMVPVGQVTLAGGHAPLEASARDAVAHYDDTRSAVMDVAIGEDRHGIWVAGALRPDVDDIKIRAVRASAVSGDWRPINNRLELVAICSVNVPGFPIPRALAADALDENGHLPIHALVAAGVEPLIMLARREPTMHALEYALLDIETKMDWMRTSMAVLASAVDDDDEVEPELAAPEIEPVPEPEPEPALEPEFEPEFSESEDFSAEPVPFLFHDGLDGEILAQEIIAASASNLLWDDGLPIHFSQAQCEAVALRLKFRRSALAVDPTRRAAALTAGAAMPDGRLPITCDEDLYAALLVVPEDSTYHAHLARRAMALKFDLDVLKQDVLVAAAAGGEKYDFKQRLKMVKTGEAMAGGAYPIKDEEDLRNAIQAYGRAKDKAACKSHLMKRARALKKVDLLPEKWSD